MSSSNASPRAVVIVVDDGAMEQHSCPRADGPIRRLQGLRRRRNSRLRPGMSGLASRVRADLSLAARGREGLCG